MLCPRADTEVVAQAAAETLAGIAAPRVLDLCAGTGCLGLGVKRFCPAAQVTCVEKSPAAFVYLEKNARCALTGQGRQTENVLEPSALEQADAPALDWGPALNALRAGQKSPSMRCSRWRATCSPTGKPCRRGSWNSSSPTRPT